MSGYYENAKEFFASRENLDPGRVQVNGVISLGTSGSAGELMRWMQKNPGLGSASASLAREDIERWLAD